MMRHEYRKSNPETKKTKKHHSGGTGLGNGSIYRRGIKMGDRGLRIIGGKRHQQN